jgi:antitoxin HicB
MPANQKPRRKKPGAKRRYTVYYLRDEEQGGYTAHIPALDIVTEGRTLAEAKGMAQDAVEGWIEAAQELGKPLPDDVSIGEVKVSR